MKHKSRAIITLVSIVTIILGFPLLAVGCGGNNSPLQLPNSSWHTYYNKNLGMGIAYPPDWMAIDITSTEVNFVPPIGNPTYSGNLLMSMDDLSANPMTLDEYSSQNIAQLKQVFKDFHSIESSATTLGYIPAQKVVYTSSLGQTLYESMQVFCIKDNKAYIITYTVEENQYANSVDTIQQMIDSVAFY